MTFTYRLIRERGGFLAECIESDVAGEGVTETDAVESLRKELAERMFRPDAVAPPSQATETEIELVLAEGAPPRPSLDLGGPGDAR